MLECNLRNKVLLWERAANHFASLVASKGQLGTTIYLTEYFLWS